MDKLKLMGYFCHIADSGSFSATAKAVNVPVSSLSRSIQALESDLGAELLKRSTRHVSLTEVGEIYRQHCLEILASVARAEDQVSHYQSEPSGVLRVSALPFFAEEQIVPLVDEFLNTYPKITLDLDISNHVSEMSSDGVDIAFRGGNLPDERLVAIAVEDNTSHLLASPSYLSAFGTPKSVVDLHAHKAIFYRSANTIIDWLTPKGEQWTQVNIAPGLITSNAYVAKEAVLAGRGMGLFPLWSFEQELKAGRVVTVALTEPISISPDPTFGIYMLYHRSQYTVPKLKVAVDFFKRKLMGDAPHN